MKTINVNTRAGLVLLLNSTHNGFLNAKGLYKKWMQWEGAGLEQFYFCIFWLRKRTFQVL